VLTFSAQTRAASLTRMAEDRFDVLVIGGGITGVGIALDAAARGLSVALVEKDDFAAGRVRLSNGRSHILDAAMELFAGLRSNKVRRT